MARPAMTKAREGFSLAAALGEFSAERLLVLLRARPDLAAPPPRDLAVLVARASSWDSVNTCMITLNRASLQLLDALCLLAQPTTVDALARTLDLDIDADDLEAALSHLGDLALLFRRGDQLQVHPQIEHLAHPAGLGPPASTVFASQQASALTAIAQRLGVGPGRTKPETIAVLTGALSDPNVLVRALRGAPKGTQDVVTRLAQHPVESVPWGTYAVRPETPLGWLAARGLIVSSDWSTFVMPREVGLAMRGGRPFPNFALRPPTLRWRPVDAGAVDRAGAEQGQRIVGDIATILDGWQDAPPKLLKAGGLGVREVRRAATAIGRSEVETARVIDVAAVAGLAGWDTTTNTALPRPAYDQWLQLDVAERWAVVVSSWLAVELHVNIAGALGTNEKPIPPLLDRWPEQPARHRRQLVLAALLEGTAGHAVEIEALEARVSWDAPPIWTGGPAMPPKMVSWVVEEAEMLGVCAMHSLTSLGREMVTGRVRQAVTELSLQTPRITSQFVIQADLTAVATGPLAASVRSELELMADLESSGSATVYRFCEASLRRAFDDGRTAERIVGFLGSHATKGVPQPLAYLVEDVGRRHGRLRVGSATCYLRGEDPSLLTEILLGRRTAKLGLRQLAPTVLVSTATPEAVIDTLRASGYLPAEEDGKGDLLVRRKAVSRAYRGYSPGPADLGKILAGPDVGAGGDVRLGDAPDEKQLEILARRLRGTRPTPVPSPPQSSAPAPPVNGKGAASSTPPPPAPSNQLTLLSRTPPRPRDIAKGRDEILDLLELSMDWEWWLRLEYTNQRHQGKQLNATVFEIDDDKRVIVGTMPGHGTQTLAISRIAWARVMTEAEESFL